MSRNIFVGYDPRIVAGYEVTLASLGAHLSEPIPVHGLVLDDLKAQGLYSRPAETRNGQMWDVISDAPMATEFSNSRFLAPILAKQGWALFMDCDMLVRADVADLFALADERYAVMCVKHVHVPDNTRKMDNQMQTLYARKNWSSLMMFQCEHPANAKLTVEMINTVPGRDLHRFCWLDDDQIGSLDPAWNWLAGHSDPAIDPKIVHFTNGTPDMRGHEKQPYAAEWWLTLHNHCTELRRA